MKRHLLAAILVAPLLSSPLLSCPRAYALVATNENATDELGQFASASSDTTLDWTQSAINNNAGSINALGFDSPGNSAIDRANHRLFVADSGNNRVLVYSLNADNSISAASGGHTASYVLGQTSMSGGGTATTQSGMSAPTDIVFDDANNRLFVADSGNNRVLLFSASSLANGMNAANELGQPSGANAFVTNGFDTTQSALKDPCGLAYDFPNTRLFVVDCGNNRVMIFNVGPGTIANGENASGLIGQSAYGNSGSGHTASKFLFPDAVAYDPANTRLFVADSGNNRVMVFSVPVGFPNGESASYALGATLTTAGTGTCAAAKIAEPGGLAYDTNPGHNTLFVGEYGNGRVTVYNVSPATITTGENASYVIGQPNFSSCGCTTNPATQNQLCLSNYLMYDPGSSRLFVDDAYDGSTSGNNRIMIFDGGVIPTGDYFNP